MLVRAERDREHAHQQARAEPDPDRRDEAEEQRARLLRDEEAVERARVHRPLDPEVEDPGALAVRLPHRAVDERRRVAERRREHVGEEAHARLAETSVPAQDEERDHDERAARP